MIPLSQLCIIHLKMYQYTFLIAYRRFNDAAGWAWTPDGRCHGIKLKVQSNAGGAALIEG